MYPAATVFLDVCVQRDFWPGGAWPLMTDAGVENVARLFALAADFGVRQGGVVCRHGDAEGARPVDGLPSHCVSPAAAVHPVDCQPRLAAPTDYVASGCRVAPDSDGFRPAFGRIVAGVRDAVVFGAGVEHGVARVVDALLRRRIWTHVVVDAIAAVDETDAQTVTAAWKRRGVDVVTVDVVARSLTLGASRLGT